ncbi:MAG: tagaturonate reductase [Lachnospiraceae bacterium]|nr:tagaturonate reductase [Lachnospiraceae bacterium]
MDIQDMARMGGGRADRPVRMLQFGEGNFLRGFVDWMVDIANDEGMTDIGVAIVKPRAGQSHIIDELRRQDFLYTVTLEGKGVKENRIVKCVADAITQEDEEKYEGYVLSPELRFVASNTTEAGIRYDADDVKGRPATFPGKVANLLWRRYKHFGGAADKGLIFLPCELIENNGRTLKEYTLRHAEEFGDDGFIEWINGNCIFADTLVDRIVSGRPDDMAEAQRELGYADELIVKGEHYHVWAIGGEGVEKIREELPLDRAGLNVMYLPDVKGFRDRKVRILNGSHTGMAALSLLLGHRTVDEAFADERINRFVRAMIAEEVIPTLPGDRKEIEAYAAGIFERFENPHLHHRLDSIAMNSISKWKARIFGALRDYCHIKGELPKRMLASLAALIALYAPGSGFEPADDAEGVEFIRRNWNKEDIAGSVKAIIPLFIGDFEAEAQGIAEAVAVYASDIANNGKFEAL